MYKTIQALGVMPILLCVHSYADDKVERIKVQTDLPAYQVSLSKVLPQQKIIDETSFSNESLATLLSDSPSISLNGQGGLFQAINIRGFARWRIQTLIEGIPIYTERRAGTSVEFLSPSFLGQAYLTAGAASTQLGSGAIGGGIDLHLGIASQNELAFQYSTNQDQREIKASGPLDIDFGKLYWQASHRHANNSVAGNGERRLDRFEQNALSFRLQNADSVLSESLFLFSSSNNVAKASADNPEDRFSLYPRSDHVLAKFSFDWNNTFVYLHDSKLDTVVTRPGRRINTTQNQALDYGVKMNESLNIDDWLLQWRLAIDGRANVKATETEQDSNNQLNFMTTILNASQAEFSGAIDASKQFKRNTFIGGSRIAFLNQKNDGTNESALSLTDQASIAKTSINDTNLSAFLGYARLLSNTWKLSGYLSSAYRVPSLTERFFNGTTPRGTVLGDVDLKTEKARNAEISLSYESDDTMLVLTGFTQKIDDYIERERINSDVRQYRNLESAKINGISYQLEHSFDTDAVAWKIGLGGQWLSGKDEMDEPVGDISPAQQTLNVKAARDNLIGFIRIVHRESSDEIVSGEITLPSTTIVDAGINYMFENDIQISANLSNIFDEEYRTTRDDLSPLAKGRDFSISFSFPF